MVIRLPQGNPVQHTQTKEGGGHRVDNFTDASFAFVVTLLIINGTEIPRDMPSLLDALAGAPAFALAFGQLALFWHGHVDWRESVGLGDLPAMLLSLLLVFFALIFVYPLHMVFSSFLQFLSAGLLPSDFVATSMSDLKMLFIIYGITFACMAGTITLLFLHSVRAGHHLDRAQRLAATLNAVRWGYSACIGVLSALVAWAIPDSAPPWLISLAGCTYALLSLMGLVQEVFRRRIERHPPAPD